MKAEFHVTRKVLFEKFNIKHEMEDFFLSFIEGCEIKENEKYPNSIFYVKNGKILFEHDCKNNFFRVRYNLVWSVFKEKYLISNIKIQAFIKNIINENLKIKDVNLLLSGGYLLSLEVALLTNFTPQLLGETVDKPLETVFALENLFNVRDCNT